MIMNNDELNTKLYEKMFAEQDTFRDWLLGQEPAAVLDHAYEYTMREDILMSLEYNDLTDAQAQSLLSSKTPLEDVFHEFENRERPTTWKIFSTVLPAEPTMLCSGSTKKS
jgi:hypothetical protein